MSDWCIFLIGLPINIDVTWLWKKKWRTTVKVNLVIFSDILSEAGYPKNILCNSEIIKLLYV